LNENQPTKENENKKIKKKQTTKKTIFLCGRVICMSFVAIVVQW